MTTKRDCAGQVTLRLSVLEPPPDTPWALQLGSDQVQPPSTSSPTRLEFEFPVRVGPSLNGDGPRLLGPAVQGPPSGRFVYLNSGRRAGQVDSRWDRRAKIPLTALTWALIEAAETRGGVLAADIAGTGRDGGPACASVPLLGAGWRVE